MRRIGSPLMNGLAALESATRSGGVGGDAAGGYLVPT